MSGAILQLFQFLLVLALAPGITGLVRKAKARLLGRRGPGLLQPYRDLIRLLRKEAVIADNASWIFRFAPYLTFTALWLAAALIPTFAQRLPLAPIADLIALVAIIGGARFAMALAGLDVGTAFGGIGSSREMMIAALAEPAMLLVIFTAALLLGTTSLPDIAGYFASTNVGLRVSLGLGLVALIMVAIAENARVPVDNPATHLELTMVHEAMILEYSGRHLAMMEGAAMMKLMLFLSLIACLFAPWGMAFGEPTGTGVAIGIASYLGKVALLALLLALFETAIAKMRVFRVSEFLATAMLLGVLAVIFLFVTKGL